ncbi:GldG family protein [candidate division KSB1 bacterium]|nr:GldG family protein [candidate division KSB1 bacterium]
MMKKFARIGGMTGLFLILLGLILYSILGTWNNWLYAPLIVGGVLVIAYLILEFEEIKRGLSSRSTKFGSNAALMIVIVFGILIVLNIFTSRFSWRLDTTAAKQFSLAEQTRNILKNLEKEVRVTGFFKSGEEARVKELLTEYAHYSKKITYEFVDPDKEPGLAKKYNIKAYGTLVLEGNGKEEKIEKSQEEDLTNALIKVTREGQKKIYFTTGHGEKDYDQTEQFGLSTAKESILDENYLIEKILLAEKDAIPEDCAVLVISGPKTDLFQKERNLIDEYLRKGGKVLFMLDPDAGNTYSVLLDDWGFNVGNDVVVDASGLGQLFGAGPTIPIVSQYETHAMTKDFGLMTFFPEARSISKGTVPSGATFNEIGKTNPRSWGETSPISTGKIGFDDGRDLRGPITLIAACETSAANPTPGKTGAKTRIVVIGDSDFPTNAYFKLQGNGDLFMNALSWLAEEEDLISVRPKDPEDRRISLTKTQSMIILYVGVILMPLVIFIVGIVVYRKHK